MFQNPDHWDPAGTVDPTDAPVFNLNSGGYTVIFDEYVETAPFHIYRDMVLFDLGGFEYRVSGPPAIGEVFVNGPVTGGSGRLTLLNGRMVAGPVVLAPQVNTSGYMNVSRGAALMADELHVGAAGFGDLLIDQGGIVSGNGAKIGMGTGIGLGTIPATGTATVTGFGSSWDLSATLTVGAIGYGSLSVLNGARVTAGRVIIGEQLRGSILISGAGSLLHTRQPLEGGIYGTVFSQCGTADA